MDSSGVLWAGADGGLLRFDAGQGKFVGVFPERIEGNSNVNSLESLPEGELAVVTDQELLILRIANPETPVIRAEFGVLNGFELLEPAENGTCWDGRPAAKGFQYLDWSAIQPAALNPHVQFNLLSSLQNYIENRSK